MVLPQTFAVGDLVMLKSWSPKMTVKASVQAGRICAVTWFDAADHQPRHAEFPTGTLMPWAEKVASD